MRANPVWAEALQLVPVISLALPIVTSGEVHLPSLGVAFTVATLLAALTSGTILRLRLVLNPLIVGTNLWLALGAAAFAFGVAPLADLMVATQGFVLFSTIGVVGVAHLAVPTGTIGMQAPAEWVRSRSLGLLALIALTIGWAWVFRDDVRLGGGLPFIVLNVARRLAIAQGLRQQR